MARKAGGCNEDVYAQYGVRTGNVELSSDALSALADLAAALNAAEQPMHDAVLELTTQDVKAALTALPVRQRGHALDVIGIHLAPKTLSQPLCRDVLGRLQRAEEMTVRHAAMHMTNGTMYGFLRMAAYNAVAFTVGGAEDTSASAASGAVTPAVPTASDVPDAEAVEELPPGASFTTESLEARWPPALLRLALWSTMHQDESTARIWAWAVDRPWFAHGSIDTDVLVGIRDSARAAIDATPDFDAVMRGEYIPHLDDVDTSPDLDELDGTAGSPTAAASTTLSPGTSSPPAAPSAVSAAQPAAAPETPPAADPEIASHGPSPDLTLSLSTDAVAPGHTDAPQHNADPDADLEAARLAFGVAVGAAESVLTDLRRGVGPHENDLTRLRTAQTTYSRACISAGSSTTTDPRPTLDEVATALLEQQAWTADAALRATIAAALRLTSTAPSVEDHLTQLRDLTGQLAATATWSDSERAVALAIAALVDLVRTPSASLASQVELKTRISAAAATSTALAVLGMLSSELTLGPDVETNGDLSTDSPSTDRTGIARPQAGRTSASARDTGEELAADSQQHQQQDEQVSVLPTHPAPTPLGAGGPSSAAAVESTAPALTTLTHNLPGQEPRTESSPDTDVAAAVAAPTSTANAAPTWAPDPAPATATTPDARTAAGPDESEDSLTAALVEDRAPRALPQVSSAKIEATVAGLLLESRYGLAAHLSQRAGWSDIRTRTFRMAGLAHAVRTGTGPCGALLRTELPDLDSSELAEDSACLLIAATSLIRIALVTGEPTAGAQLGEISSRLDPHLASICEEVGRRALRGVLSATPALHVLADVNDAERALALTVEEATAALRPRTLRFKRCSDIAKRWLDPSGLLGEPLTRVISNDTASLIDVETRVQHLSDPSVRERVIDELDAHFRGTSGKPIEGAGRQDLHALVLETLRPVRSWLELTAAMAQTGGQDEWTTGEVADMRSALLAQRDQALAALTAQTTSSKSALVTAAADAAHASLTQTFSLLDGTESLHAGEPRVTVALDLELLKADSVAVGEAGTLALEPIVDALHGASTVAATATPGSEIPALVAAAQRTWAEAFDAHVAAENYPAALYLLKLREDGTLPAASLPDDARSRYTSSLERSRRELHAVYASVDQDLRRARRSNVVSEETDSELTAMLVSADPTRDLDLGQVRTALTRISTLLPAYRELAAERLRTRVAALDIDDDERARITAPIEDGDLLTAEELLYFQEIGEQVPRTDHSRSDLIDFYPHIPQTLPDGITPALLRAVNERTRFGESPVLDFADLSPDAAEQTATALAAWRQLATTPAASRRTISERELLLPALRLIGYNCSRIRRLDDLSKGPERRFIEITDVKPNSNARIPAFGSKLGGRLRVLLVWGQPADDLLLSYAEHDTSGDSLLVAHFGTMSSTARARFAARVERTGAPIAILDDAALAYLAARGNRQLAATMSVLMPFTAVNPYIRMKRGAVAEEMFYGRDQERYQVVDPDGTQVLYGGRGLGKSALLRYAGEKFEGSSAEPGQRITVYLSLDSVAAGAAFSKDALWVGLRNTLTDRGVLTPPTGRTGRVKVTGDVYDQVRAGVITWRNADSRNRLLILLDESDGFFENDAPEFLDTKRLRDIGVVTDNNIKVVFAGLHSVQRYAKSARNGPFSHLAQRPTVIGPLRPQFAADLLTVPLGVMGYQFADDNLVNRILGYCSYQPFLLQMFGHRLVEAMHAGRRDGLLAGQPPYAITDEDVAAVERNPDLRADITSAFQDTLNLDPRYNVIANVLADHALRYGFDARLQDVALRDECLSWWADGFESLDSESFRAYLNEMDGLGVVAPNNDGRGWRLRSPNVLNMIGTRADVERQLLQAAYESVPDTFLALESRPTLVDNVSAPLTAAQLDDILGNHSTHTRVVLGSRATGLERVAQTLKQITEQAGDFDIPPITGRRVFEEELRGGLPGRRRVVIDDLATVGPQQQACVDALELALGKVPTAPGVTRAAVLVSSPEQADLWKQALERGVAVALRRYDQRTLRVWSINRQHFQHEERFERLWQLTRGWPLLVERAAQLANAESGAESVALEELAAYVDSPAGRADLLDAVGLNADPQLMQAYGSIVALVDDQHVSRADLQAAVDMDGMGSDVVDRLVALQLFDTDSNAAYSLDLRVRAAWDVALR